MAGGLLRWRGADPSMANAVWGAGAVIVAVYALVRPSRRLIYLGWMYAAFPIGWTVSHIFLAAIYYLVFTPVGLLLRLVKGDPLEHGLDRSASTYWAKRPPTGDMRRYFRQF